MLGTALSVLVERDSQQTPSNYYYVPNFAANLIGAILFGLILINQLALGAYTRDWWMFVSWGITAALELLTYIGRVIGHYYPLSMPMYEMQLVCSIFAPAFMAAGLYYLLGKQVTLYGEKYSPLSPMTYTAIFTTADVISFFVQGGGGGVAASSTSNYSVTRIGGRIVLGGIAFQVLILIIFIGFWSMVNWRIFHDYPQNWDPKFAENRERPLFKWFLPSVCVSLLFLLIRSIYRIAELSGGWDGPIVRTERYFLICDGLMIVLGMLPLCIVYPGLAYGYVPVRGLNYKGKKPRYPVSERSITESDVYFEEKNGHPSTVSGTSFWVEPSNDQQKLIVPTSQR